MPNEASTDVYADMQSPLSASPAAAPTGRGRNGGAGRDLSPGEDGVSRSRPRKATHGSRGIRPTLAAALAGTLLLGACTPGEDPGPVVGSPATAYGARTLAGDSVTLADLRGKVVLLNFWATWCTPCRHETPFLDSLHARRSPEGLEVVGVSMDAPHARDQVADFVREFGVRYTILLDPQMRGSDLYRVVGLPASFLVDRDGVLRWMRFGPVSDTDRDFLAALESVLQ
ncbi:MAG TPA: TlpA disulfide reductase family protein [Longimicrobiales bacterium]|nr:TlpA disulfide reductase family protein [Longimicrobiales bacterium]